MSPPPIASWNALRAIIPEYSRWDGLNGEWHVDSLDSYTDTFYLSSNAIGNYINTNVKWSDRNVDAYQARFVLAKSVPSVFGDIIGPYAFDLGQPFTVGGKTVLLNQEIKAGTSSSTLRIVGDAFSIKDGYLLFNLGFSSQTGPVRCYSAVDDTTIMIDAGFKFPFDLGFGSYINILHQRAAFEPDSPIGSFWLTASNAGRAAAIDLLRDISAAGIELDIETRYPGDRGLGAEGFPVIDSLKISDIVEMFGRDDLEQELEEARGTSTQ
jgi:hypothetical protein